MLEQPSFNKLGLAEWLLKTCSRIKYYAPTRIQQLSMPAILKGESVIINSETGSGKTAAFAFPILHVLSKEPTSVFAVVVAPSLELAMQIHQQMSVFGQGINLRLALLVGGVNYSRQILELEQYPHVVIGTPGRLAEMIGKCQQFAGGMKQTEFVVLDEADRLFEEKTLPNMRSIMQAMPNLKQCVLATATIDSNFQANRLKSLLSFGVCFVKYSTYTTNLTVRTLTQSYIFTPEALKPSYLLELLEQNRPYKIIVFVKTCRECTLMFETLQKLGHSVTQLHSSMKNSQRIGNLAMFRSDQVSILVTTDLTSRGLDIAMVNMVINYNIPKTVSDYVHRVGRTARNGHEGEAVTFVTPQEIDIFKQIEEKIGVTITAHELDGQTQLELVSQYNKVKRAVKIELVSNGVLGDLQQRRQKKLARRAELANDITN